MAIFFRVKVVPGSGRNEWKIDKSGAVKCYLKSQAEEGQANAELIKLLAKKLSITQDKITIVQGVTSRQKRIKIDIDISYDALLQSLVGL